MLEGFVAVTRPSFSVEGADLDAHTPRDGGIRLLLGPAPRASRTAALVLARLTSLAVHDTVPPSRRAGLVRPRDTPQAPLRYPSLPPIYHFISLTLA